MRFQEMAIPGIWLIEPERNEDERGFFARTWCREELEQRGLSTAIAQCSLSFSPEPATLRGMHLQDPPWAEIKIVRCTAGAIFDVAIDLRPSSPTYKQWVSCELNARNRSMLYIPEGVAHGFQTLEPATEIFYQISSPYHPEAARGVRWNDPAFGITWPEAPRRIISARDAAYADFDC